MASSSRHPTRAQPYESRSNSAGAHPLTVYLLRLMAIKQTNLCVSADVTTTNQLLELAEEVGDSIVLLKTHADIVSDFTERTIRRLREVSTRKHFIVFEDRKFGDIGSTVQKQYVGGPFSIVRWAPIVNAHVFPGPTIITALKEAAEHSLSGSNAVVSTEISADELAAHPHDSPFASSSSSSNPGSSASGEAAYVQRALSNGASGETVVESDDSDGQLTEQHRKPSIISVSSSITMRYENLGPPPSPGPKIPLRHPGESVAAAIERLGPPPLSRGLLLLAQMSSEDNLLTPQYTRQCMKMAREHRDFVVGFIAQENLNNDPADNFITMTPGVSLAGKSDGLGQQYNGPQKVVKDAGSDVIIVGRAIVGAEDRAEEAEKYRAAGWKAYEDRIGLKKVSR